MTPSQDAKVRRPEGYQFRPRPLFLYLVGRSIAFYFALAGFAFDSIKALLFPNWRPNQLYGARIFLLYAACNLAVPVLFRLLSSIHSRRRHLLGLGRDWIHISLGISIFSSGFLNWLFLLVRDNERALIPVVFHGGFAFLGIIVLSSAVAARDQLIRWSKAARIIDEKGREVRQTFKTENRELTRNVIQAMTLWSAMVAVAMTILYIVKSRNGWKPTDPDLVASGIQLLVGLLTGCCSLWFWGLKPSQYVKQRVGRIALVAAGSKPARFFENYFSLTIYGGVFFGPVAAKIEHCNTAIDQAARDEHKLLLEQLMNEATNLIQCLPEAKRGDATNHVKLLVDSAIAKEPNRRLYEISAQRLIGVSKSLKPTVNIARTIGQLGKLLWPDFQLPSIEGQ